MAQRRQTPQQKFAKIKSDHLKKLGGESSLFPQTAAPERATKKALQAWQSELRRLERTLQEREEFLKAYEQRLIEREQQLEREIANFEEWREEYGFGEDCDDTCDCEYEDSGQQLANKLGDMGVLTRPAVGDEVTWLEKLFTLKDKRKK